MYRNGYNERYSKPCSRGVYRYASHVYYVWSTSAPKCTWCVRMDTGGGIVYERGGYNALCSRYTDEHGICGTCYDNGIHGDRHFGFLFYYFYCDGERKCGGIADHGYADGMRGFYYGLI